ncbi:MAG: flap endonuclease-1 [Thermoplasmata archaeon]|nr:flap endonuclease-1 [Thermoplasmata archaeon]
MGVDIASIVETKPAALEDFSGKIVAIDGYNTLYQFLAIIRQSDGTLLMDSRGRVTSHLSGLFYRTANFLETGIKPVFVFDGEPYPQKRRTIEGRIAVKEKAMEEWKKALEEGDMERAKSKAQQTSHLTREMVSQAKQLLGYMGIPCIDAPRDGEAQASYLVRRGDAHYSGSQDFDSLLFGSPALVRNLAISGKRKLPRKNEYVDIKPEAISLQEVLQKHGLTWEQLVDIGILVGTDFNEGVRGIGAKKALKLIKEFGSIEKVIEAKKIEVPGYEETRKIFLQPDVTQDYSLKWSLPDTEKIVDMLCEEFGFSEERVRKALGFVETRKIQGMQTSLDQFF